MFLLSLLDLAGVYIDTGLLLVVFTLLQLALIYKSGAGEDANAHAAIPTESRWLVVLFFCSGFAALIYQMVWQRTLFQAFGVNIESVTIIVSIFMFGLGIGALAGGTLSKKYPRHLPHLFVACELLIGLFGLFNLSLIGAVTQPSIHGSLLTLSVAIYGLLFVPTLVHGGYLAGSGQLSIQGVSKRRQVPLRSLFRQYSGICTRLFCLCLSSISLPGSQGFVQCGGGNKLLGRLRSV